MNDKPLNLARKHFCREYANNGHNGAEAYRVAYPRCNTGHNENACRLLTIDSVRQEILRLDLQIAAKAKHNREIAVKLLNENLVFLTKRVNAGDVGAISARTAVIRELNACSGCHSSTINVKGDELPPISEVERRELLRLSKGLDDVKEAV